MTENTDPTDARLDDFCKELTALCHKYGFGIADEPSIFEMEHEDEGASYTVNDGGRLVW